MHARSLVPFLLALLLLGCSAASPPGPNPGRIQPGVGLEEVKLGDNRIAVEGRLGKPEATEANPFNARNTLALYYGKGIEISYDGDTVGTLVVHPAVAPWSAYQGSTAQGVWVGSNPAGVRKAMGSPQKDLPQALMYPGLWVRLDREGKIESLSLGG